MGSLIWRTAAIISLLIMPTLVFAEDEYLKDPFFTQGVSRDAPPINSILENVDPFSGTLTVSQTDVHLPGNGGLDINLIRTYNSMIWGRRDNVLYPGLIAQLDYTPLGVGWSMHMGMLRNPFGTGGNKYVPDHPVFEMPDGSQHIFYRDKNDASQFISKDLWRYKKFDGYGEITLTDGTVYTFDFNSGASFSYNNGGYPTKPNYFVTKIQNAAGTSIITMSYYRDTTYPLSPYPYLKTITDSQDRTITLDYDYVKHRLMSITVDNRTFNYTYETTSGRNLLQSCTPPVGNAWTYEYEPSLELSAINYPTGGTKSYKYEDVLFQVTAYTRVRLRVVTGKNTTGRGINDGSWTYSYNSGGSSGDITTITAPGVTETHKFYGWGNTRSGDVWRMGLPISKSFSGEITLTESYDWLKGSKISYEEIGNAPWSGVVYFYDNDIYIPFQTTKSITREGQTYTTTFGDFDYYGNPGTISEVGDRIRNKTITYWNNTSKNIVTNKPSSVTTTGPTGYYDNFSGTSTTRWLYDTSSGNVTQLTNNDVITKYGYDISGNLSSITDANNHQKTYLWSNGMVSRVKNPFYNVSRVVNSDGTIRSETNGRNFKTSYLYDKNLRPTRITPPVGNYTTISYPPDSSTRTETRGSYTITHKFDGFGRPTGSIDSRGVTTLIAYNAYGVKDYSDSGNGDKVYYDYFGRVKQVVHKDNSTISNSYNGSNLTVTDENNKTITYTNNAFGDPDERYLVSVKDQALNTTSYGRNILGLLTAVKQDHGNIERSFVYNSKYFLTSESNPETGTITYGRDAIGNMISKSDSSGTKSYTYDSIDRLTKISSGSNSLTYGYDKAGNKISMSSPTATSSYVYDAANRLTSESKSLSGRMYSTAYLYDGNDNITKTTYPSARAVNAVFNNNNQITSITGLISNVTYYTSGISAGLPRSYQSANGLVTNISYNDRQAVESINAGSALDVYYSYDSRGNTQTLTNYLDSSKSQSFYYDELSRLTGFNGAWGYGSFLYDAVGNRTVKTVAGASTSYGYVNNRMTSASGGEPATYAYTGYGALSGGTWGGKSYSLVYDSLDNLSSVSVAGTTVASYGYDGNGMRVTKTSGGNQIVYHYDQTGKVLTENDAAGKLIADYVYLNGKLVAKIAPAPPVITINPMAVWRPSGGIWVFIDSTTGVQRSVQWGGTGDIPAPVDYDGDGKTDIAVWRPSTGTWFIINSATNTQHTVNWGTLGDIPVPGDYDGDGKADIAVWRPAAGGSWFIINSATGTQTVTTYGGLGDIPVPRDYDGDGKTDIAVWRPSTSTWFIINSANGTQTTSNWGDSADTSVPADYDCDGKTDIAVWRPSTGIWFIINSATGTQTSANYGDSADIPVPCDYDGDGKADIAVWRPSSGTWFVIKSATGTQSTVNFGTSGDIPVPSVSY